MPFPVSKLRVPIIVSALAAGALLFLNLRLAADYRDLNSKLLVDRSDAVVRLFPNAKGFYNRQLPDAAIPSTVRTLAVNKEDRFFFFHPGINPVSILRALPSYLSHTGNQGASTITQQLAKILLGHENERTVANKLSETLSAVALELFTSKQEILARYLNSVYFGNRIQGIGEASRFYFQTRAADLSTEQALQLIASVSNPNALNPLQDANISEAQNVARRLAINVTTQNFMPPSQAQENAAAYLAAVQDPAFFEIRDVIGSSPQNRSMSIDAALTRTIRSIAKETLDRLADKNARQATVLVVELPTNRVLAMVGSPDPSSTESGNQINMLREPRAVGSTLKPLIYAKGFEAGLRPYSLVEDREYKYYLHSSLPFYPRNFDEQYHGTVTLHYALNNSLNVPAVKVLEYAGIDSFAQFLGDTLHVPFVQEPDQYGIGFALGTMEMSPWELGRIFTALPNRGTLLPLTLEQTQPTASGTPVIDPQFVGLVNAVLSDHTTGMDQFGRTSTLTVPLNAYALKTGTSRDFRDSWVIGYTPDFLVLVWVGNADISPMDNLSGQTGAGKIWNRVMELMATSPYHRNTAFSLNPVTTITTDTGTDFGLPDDGYATARFALMETAPELILSPHDNDSFVLVPNLAIPLKAREQVQWSINGAPLALASSTFFSPATAGRYSIRAQAGSSIETVTVSIAPQAR